MGQAPSGDAYNDLREGWPLIAGAGDFGDGVPEPKKFTTKASKLSFEGDIVLGIRASIGEKVLADSEYCLGRGVAGLRPLERLNNRYLWHWLTFAKRELGSRGKGATFKQVNREDIGSLEVPLPPLAEQCRIAVILDLVDALRAKRRESIARLESLTQSVFQEMFGDVVWPSTTVGQVADVQVGLQVTSARSSCELVAPYLRVANIYRLALNLREIKTIRLSPAELSRTILQQEDLLVVEGHGNPREIGRSALWDGSISGCVHQNHLIRCRFDRARVSPAFAAEYLNSDEGRKFLLRGAKTTSGLNTISSSQVRSTPLLLPPLALQQEFASRVGKIETLKASHRAHLAELDTLFASLKCQAFSGEPATATS